MGIFKRYLPEILNVGTLFFFKIGVISIFLFFLISSTLLFTMLHIKIVAHPITLERVMYNNLRCCNSIICQTRGNKKFAAGDYGDYRIRHEKRF